jgi:hypothetical protein
MYPVVLEQFRGWENSRLGHNHSEAGIQNMPDHKNLMTRGNPDHRPEVVLHTEKGGKTVVL